MMVWGGVGGKCFCVRERGSVHCSCAIITVRLSNKICGSYSI